MNKILTIIVGSKYGKKILESIDKSLYKEVFLLEGTGTSSGGLHYLLKLYDIKKDIISFIVSDENLETLYRFLLDDMGLGNDLRGIAFDIDIEKFEEEDMNTDRREEGSLYDAIFAIVNQGHSDNVILASERAGSIGATVLSAKGSGYEKRNPILELVVEPEKEVVLIISPHTKTDAIIDSIDEDMNSGEKKNAITFAMNVNRVEGLRSWKILLSLKVPWVVSTLEKRVVL